MLLATFFSASAAFGDVLHDQDNGPLTGIYGIPDSTEGGRLIGRGQSAWDFSITHASHSLFEARPTEALYLDGESSRFEFRYRVGISDDLEVGIELPYITHRGGKLDSFIDQFHNLFGMPEGNRPQRGHDILDFRYADLSGLLINTQQSSEGIGDIRLFGGWQFARTDRHQMALRFGLKFASGDSQHLQGSGGTDLSIGVAGDVSNVFGSERLSAFYRLHAIHIGQPDVLPDRYRKWVGFTSAGMGYQVSDRIQLWLQGAVRTATYHSVIHSLGGNSTTATFGGNLRLFRNFELSFAISEDADVATAPDVAFQLALRYRDYN